MVMLQIALSFLIMIFCYVVIGVLSFKGLIKKKGEKLVEEAKKCGRETIGKRIKFYRRHEKSENRNDETYKAKYEYFVNNKRYTTYKITKNYPNINITIYYKENSKAIKEDSDGIIMKVIILLPIIVFVLSMWIQIR